MFGWGKKKQAEVVAVEPGNGFGGVAADGGASDDTGPIPAAVYVAVAAGGLTADDLDAEVSARAAGITGVVEIQSVADGQALAVTMLAARDGDPEIVFLSARAGGLSLAGALEGRATLYVVACDRDGEALETYRIDPPPPEAAPQPQDALDRMVAGLARSSSKLAEGLGAVLTKRKLDAGTLDELEDLLLSADLGASASRRLRDVIAKDRFGRDISPEEVRAALAAEITAMLVPYETHDDPWSHADGTPGPKVIMFVGVNGSGKTTTIGKIAHNLVQNGHSVMLAAGDTFRAAAVEQLKVWGERAGVPVIARDTGADSAGLAFDAMKEATAAGTDVLLIDTAGRLQNKSELMAELAKVVRVLGKQSPGAPHEVWLVLDATVGQNALSQAEAFRQTAGITGLVMTKLDGTAKGGVLLAVTQQHKLPVRFVGVGEKPDDLQPFSAEAFARGLVGA
jgi:fused signal recognition particle receptor